MTQPSNCTPKTKNTTSKWSGNSTFLYSILTFIDRSKCMTFLVHSSITLVKSLFSPLFPTYSTTGLWRVQRMARRRCWITWMHLDLDAYMYTIQVLTYLDALPDQTWQEPNQEDPLSLVDKVTDNNTTNLNRIHDSELNKLCTTCVHTKSSRSRLPLHTTARTPSPMKTFCNMSIATGTTMQGGSKPWVLIFFNFYYSMLNGHVT